MGLPCAGPVVTRETATLPILVGGRQASGAGLFAGSAGAGSLAAGRRNRVCPAVKGVVAGRVAGSASQGFLLRADQIQHLQGDAVGPSQSRPAADIPRRRRRCRSSSRHTSPPAFCFTVASVCCTLVGKRRGDLHGDLLLTIVLQPLDRHPTAAAPSRWGRPTAGRC